MPKFSVKRPFTVLVGVILTLVLGVVSLWNMPTDLLPGISLPYLVVVTSYPGASPEKVESEVTGPLEGALGTVNGVENVSSNSAENYSMVMLEFAEDTDMDSAMVKASTAINELADALPDTAGTPMLIEMSPDMLPTQYVAVDYEGMDIYDLSTYTEEHVMPAIERVAGVANVTATGLVEQTVEITLQQDMIDKVNDRLLRTVSERFDEAAEQLETMEDQYERGQKQLKNGQKELDAQQEGMAAQLEGMIAQLDAQIPQLEQRVASLGAQIEGVQAQIEQARTELNGEKEPEPVQVGDLGIDEGLLESTKTVLAELDPQYDAAKMPKDLQEAKGDPVKLGNMHLSIGRAQAVLQNQAKALLGDYSDVDTAVAGLNQETTALTMQIATTASQLADIEEQITNLRADPESGTDATKKQQLEELEAQEKQLTQAQSTAQAQLDASQKRLDALTQIQTVQNQLGLTDAALSQAQTVLTAEEAARQAVEQTANQLQQQALEQLEAQLPALNASLDAAQAQLESLNGMRASMQGTLAQLAANPLDPQVGEMAAQLILSGTQAQLQLGQFQMQSMQAQLESGREQYESAREQALEQANLDQLLNMGTLSQLLGAQNFSMPAGYIQDGDISYLLKVGEAYESIDDIAGTLLVSQEGLGDVYLRDVATIELTDNAGDAYAKMDGNQAVLLAIYKGSTASTSDVSDAANAAMDELMAQEPGLHLTPIMDQGDYIRLIVDSVMSNLLWGAALAIIVLILFLKDFRPTAVVAISIPLSVLFAIVLMYFSGITLNMISLSGLALGIGMLVDNSIVVIENIYRLRARGVPAARAAVQGARQMSGAIVASTATTVCVFLPLVFSEGLTRQLMTDMALTIAYSLAASLIVALTVVPCAGSTVLRTARDIPHPWFERVVNAYEKALRFCLRVKAVPLALAIGLLAFSVWQVLNMGLVLLPEISSNQISVTLRVDEDLTTREEAYALADTVMDRTTGVEGVATVGAMSSSAVGSIVSGLNTSDSYGSFTYYVLMDPQSGRTQAEVEADIQAATAGVGSGQGAEVSVDSGSSMDLSALTGSGVEVDIYGNDIDTLLQLGDSVIGLMQQTPGIVGPSNGQEEADTEIRVVVDRDKAMRLGLTVAQVYSELAAALTTESTTTSLTVGADTYTVTIVDTTKKPDLKGVFDYPFKTTRTDGNGNQTTETHTLGEFASRLDAPGVNAIARENQSRYLTITSSTAPGYNTSLLARDFAAKLEGLDVPEGYTISLAGESTQVDEMLKQMGGMLALAFILVYLVMVAQFQSLLSPFIVLFTIPLAFTGGMLGLLLSGEVLSLLSLMGFLVLMGVVVNNGIVFVDYTNQLRIGGLDRQSALVATGRTRMRPILMTTLTTVLAMVVMIFSTDTGSEMGRGMAIVIVGGLLYATLMTLFIVPVVYDTLFKRPPVDIDVGDEGMDDLPDDAAEFAAQMGARLQPAAPGGAQPAPQGPVDDFPDFPIETKRPGKGHKGGR